MKFYNTYSKNKEEFKVDGKTIKMYNCGPTVYDNAHIGNFRSFLFADVLRRYFEYKGFTVEQVMNFTDVGHMTQDDLLPDRGDSQNVDKMALAVKKTGIKDPYELANYFIKAFMEDSKALRCKEPHKRPKASEHIKEMIEVVKKLIEKGHAYEKDGFVFFDHSSFPNYGKLSGNTVEDLVAGHRVEIDDKKKHPADFALWKEDDKHIMKWDSPWGIGFPGWHIECSAMATKYLGDTIDIHTGGEDNIFPHHEAEIAQTEGATGKQFVRYWMHARHLLVDGTKMSKSKGNFFTAKDLLEKGYRGEEIRYALISSHYRQNMNFITGMKKDATREEYKDTAKIEALEEAKTSIKRVADFVYSMKNIPESKENPSKDFKNLVSEAYDNFEKNLDDDLNVSGALSVMFNFIREVNKLNNDGKLSYKAAQKSINLIYDLNRVFDILPDEINSEIPEEILELVKEREEARKNKNYSLSDEIRNKIQEKGFNLEDTTAGTICKKS